MRSTLRNYLGCLLMCVALLDTQVFAQAAETTRTQQLTDERLMLTAELEQFRQALEILHTDGTPPEQSPNSAVRTLAIAAAALKQQLIVVTEQEAAVLRTHNSEDALAREPENVERLHTLLESHYTELQESAGVIPSAAETAPRELVQSAAETRDNIPFSVDKVRLSGAEGSTALAQISQRLMDPGIPESRRDMAPICSIKTRLLDTLVGVENRSLKPVGKNHYIVKVRLQPGETTISILSHQWKVLLPQDATAQDFLITLYRPVEGTPELHVFAVDDLLAAHKPPIPAWLSDELDLKTKAG